MVPGKVKVAMGLQSSPANPKPDPSPKPPLPSPSSAKVLQKAAVFSRSFGVHFQRSSAQVQPRPPDVTELLRLVEELRERESRLKTELLEHKLLRESVSILPVLENEIASRDAEIARNGMKIECLEAENERLRQDLEILHTKALEEKKEYEKKVKAMEAEIMELKRVVFEVSRTDSRRFRNSDLVDNDEFSSMQRFQGLIDVSGRSNLIKNLKKGLETSKNGGNCENVGKNRDEIGKVERPKLLPCNSEEITEISECSSLRSRAPRVPKPPPTPSFSFSSPPSDSSRCSFAGAAERASTEEHSALPPPRQTVKVVPPPPPPPLRAAPAPPPPPPPPKCTKTSPAKVRRVPEVVEFYHSLMRRDSRREPGGGPADGPAANPRDMIGEIENRSAHLLAIKTDVETQGDFIRFLIKEVENAAFVTIEDVVPFVKWLDDELSFLVDERAVLKRFEWPEQKADALREAAFGYSDLKKLESDASSFCDDPRQSCAHALKKMQAFFEKLERAVYGLSRMRESASKRYSLFQIPTDWMCDTGYVSQMKLASVKLAMKYMKRVSTELEIVGGGAEEEELVFQGVRFAFRVHQFAGGFDVETMRAFQELRDKARCCHTQCPNQQQKYLYGSAPC